MTPSVSSSQRSRTSRCAIVLNFIPIRICFGFRVSDLPVYTFGHDLDGSEVARDFARTGPRAALGPVSVMEEEVMLAAAAQSMAAMQPVDEGAMQFAMGAAQYGCNLWLEIAKSATPNEMLVTVHNTVPGKMYTLWSTEDLVTLNWTVEQTSAGTAGQDFTEFQVSMMGASGLRPMLYFQATEASQYEMEINFEGLSLSDTLISVADTMGAVGPTHFVEILNNAIAVYHKSGLLAEDPIHSANFFEIEDNDVVYPTSGNVFDPRILYDHQSQRWVACGLDPGSRDVLLAVSNDHQPVPLQGNWNKFRMALSRPGDPADFPTLGLDANGVYVSVIYCNSHSNAIAVANKTLLYQGSLATYYFPTDSTASHLRIIQPPVNFDATPTGNYAWLIAKDPPEYDANNYQGGPLVYRRLQWAMGIPSWADVQWITVAEPNPTYRDYFDLDEGDPENGAPQAGTPLFPDPIKIRVDGAIDGGVGSRLGTTVIRDGTLWTCHHVGLDGGDGVYNGDSLGASVDRSAVQWIRLEIDANGELMAVNNQSHGRFYDDCEMNPRWYYYPSLMVNANGDLALGFSGSNENTFISAFYAWRLSNGISSDRACLIKAGEYYFDSNRWGDYSHTSLDPVDGLTFWTVQEFAKFPVFQSNEWGTRIAKLAAFP